MLAKSKLNSIETLVSQALIDMKISHEEFITILKEKDKYEKMKENVRSVSEKQENMRLNSVNSKKRVCKQVVRQKLSNIYIIKNFYLLIYLFIYLSIYLSIYLFIY